MRATKLKFATVESKTDNDDSGFKMRNASPNVGACEKWLNYIRLNKYGNLSNRVKYTILEKQIVCLLRRSIIWYQRAMVTDNGQIAANSELLISDFNSFQGKMERITPHLRKTSRIHTRVRVRAMERRARARMAAPPSASVHSFFST